MDPIARIIDASANRASEGLRAMEDIARFALDAGGLCAQIKHLRHGLRTRVAGLPIPPSGLTDARDTPGDVGTAISTPSESDRPGLGSIASAGAHRAAEALRSIEECAKAIDADAGWFEQARYKLYDIERTLTARLRRIAPQWKLCVLLSADLCAPRSVDEIAQLALLGGADCLQIREKTMDSGPLLELTTRVVRLARAHGASVIVNDRADIARLGGADGVHVGQNDLSVSQTRRVGGAGMIVGVSTACLDDARRAASDGASYCGVGPMFASTTKPKPSLPGPAYLRAYLSDPATLALPHLAISGISPSNLEELVAGGCRGVAVSSVVCGASDPRAVCAQIVEQLGAEGNR